MTDFPPFREIYTSCLHLILVHNYAICHAQTSHKDIASQQNDKLGYKTVTEGNVAVLAVLENKKYHLQ